MGKKVRFVILCLAMYCLMGTAMASEPCSHTYEWKEEASTCTDAGMGYYECSICGDQYGYENLEALGHDFEEWTTDEEATCTQPGLRSRTCRRCAYRQEEVTDETGHHYETVVTEPTCEKQGYTQYTCDSCGDSYKADYTEATGHHYDNGVVIQRSSTTAAGKILYTCSGCGNTYTETTPKLINPFVDVEKEDYFFPAVLWAVEQGVTNGVDETHFAPNEQCTRAQVVTFLWRAWGEPEPLSEGTPFADVPRSAYFYKAVLWAAETGVTTGTDEDHFSPNEKCTRAQVVTFLYRAEGAPEAVDDAYFADVQSNDYFAKPVAWALQREITNGMDDYHFGPEQTCTRGQVVTFLYRDRYNDQ